ncbi:MAG TPA: choice-of-anchor Q domain-containing protein, partial [Rhodanobacteraceae bacterium]
MQSHSKEIHRGIRVRRGLHSRRLAAALAVALGTGLALETTNVQAAPPVTNCGDTGSGSLRASVAAAASGDVIDMTNLACGTITLTSGAIAVTQYALYLDGPGQDLLTIDGDFNDRVFRHTGGGVLALYDLTVTQGKYVSTTTPYGGCIYSNGGAKIYNTTVSDCYVVSQSDLVARGGGIDTTGSGLLLDHSTITGNTAHGLSTGAGFEVAVGGGIFVSGDFIGKYSTISDNVAVPSDENHNSSGGGIAAFGYFGLMNSTISGNSATGFGAVLIQGSVASGHHAAFIDSTISQNYADSFSGIYTQIPTTISNSTIAFNRAKFGRGALYSQVASLDLESTIIAGNENVDQARPDDLNGTASTPLTGANNLITSSTIGFPPGTITGCPHLDPLADNGGPTRTNALRNGSPAIDQGNNTANLDYDQRGDARIFGAAP